MDSSFDLDDLFNLKQPAHLSYHLAQLGNLFSGSGTSLDGKILLVPIPQVGHEILSALAMAGHNWVNVRATTVLRHALSMLDEWEPDSGDVFLSGDASVLLVENILETQGGAESRTMSRAAGAIARTIRDLRLAGIDPDTYEKASSTRFRRVVAETYRKYVELLISDNLMDEASVLSRAVKLVSVSGTNRSASALAILDEVVLSDHALAYVQAVGEQADSVWRIGWSTKSADPPFQTAASRLSHWPVPSVADHRVLSDDKIEILSAVGAENEVRAVLRRIADRGLSLDCVEIAYSKNEPYLSIIRTLSARYGLPITLASGVSARGTAVGQAVRSFVEWVRDGLSVDRLVAMLRGGQIDLGLSEIDGRSLSLAAAETLAGNRIGRGAGSYRKVLALLGEDARLSVERAQKIQLSRSAIESAVETERSHAEVSEALEPLLKLADVPGKVSFSEFSDRISGFIDNLLPRPDSNLRAEEFSGFEKGTPDEPFDDLEFISRREIKTRIEQISRQIRHRMSLHLVIRTVVDMLAGAFFKARAARPGALHVVPLSSAGFASRSHLFIVGMDEKALVGFLPEDPLLTDNERRGMSKDLTSQLPTAQDTDRLGPWFFQRALSRTSQSVTVAYSRYSVSDDRTLFPSSALQRVLAAKGLSSDDLSVHSFAPLEDGFSTDIPLDITDVLLASRQDLSAILKGHDLFPWLCRGHEAHSGRLDGSWTAYDGFLGVQSDRLDPFRSGHRVSASRLETLTQCPFRYYVKYILRIRPLEEPEDYTWMTALQKGSLVHEGLRQFMVDARADGRTISDEDIPLLISGFEKLLFEYCERNPSPNPAELNGFMNELQAITESFVADEKERQNGFEPYGFEFGFGLTPFLKKRDSDRTDPVILDLDGLRIQLFGWIDRIDRLSSGGFAVTDYKTGESDSYDPSDLLNGGKSLQWALYAYVVEELMGEPVPVSGYLFPGSRALGRRIEADPSEIRKEVADRLRQMGALARSGLFVQAVDPNGTCKWCDYQRLCGDLKERKKSIDIKLAETDPGTGPYELLRGWSYADKKLSSEE